MVHRRIVALVTLLGVSMPPTLATPPTAPRVATLGEDRVTGALERHDGREWVGLRFEVEGETVAFRTPLDGVGDSLLTVNGEDFTIGEPLRRRWMEASAGRVAGAPAGAAAAGFDFELVEGFEFRALELRLAPGTLERIAALTHQLLDGLDPCDPLVAGTKFFGFGLIVIGCSVGCLVTGGATCLVCAGGFITGTIGFLELDHHCSGRPLPPPNPSCEIDQVPTPEDPCVCSGCLDPNVPGPEPACCYG